MVPTRPRRLTAYLAEHVAHKERRPEQVRVELLARCRAESIEPPTPGRCDRIVAGALRAAEESLTARISSRLPAESIDRLVALVAAGTDQDDDAEPGDGGTEGEDAPPVLGKIKEAPGNVYRLRQGRGDRLQPARRAGDVRRILQSALVYLNTLMLQDVLGEPEWADLLTSADRRGLTRCSGRMCARTGR
ncbi:hypothetical protein [Streptomyces sp. NPDC001292]|uniref:hypothetical protein n=1 Tax=Streptomyces sp. NPDC001292 TaxID=3364558 RepID=UPI0036AC03EF